MMMKNNTIKRRLSKSDIVFFIIFAFLSIVALFCFSCLVVSVYSIF